MLKTALFAAILCVNMLSQAPAQQFQCANGVCRLVEMPARAVSRVVHPRRAPTVTIEARTANLDVGPLSGPRPAVPSPPPGPPAAFIRSPSCSCDPCECGTRQLSPPAGPAIRYRAQQYATRAVWLPHGGRFRVRAAMRSGSCCQ